MSLSFNDILQSLLKNITDYYTVTYSSDTDLYQILRMFSKEFNSGSVSIDTTRDNAFVASCESSQLFNNFGSFFDTAKSSDQGNLEDRYLTWTSGTVINTQPAIFRDITSIIPTSDWTTLGSFPSTWHWNFLNNARGWIGTPITKESVYWSGSIWARVFLATGKIGTIFSTGQTMIVNFNPSNNTFTPSSYFTDPNFFNAFAVDSMDELCLAYTNGSSLLPVPAQFKQWQPHSSNARMSWSVRNLQGSLSLFSPVYLKGGGFPKPDFLDEFDVWNNPGKVGFTRTAELHGSTYFGFSGIESGIASLYNGIRQRKNRERPITPEGFPVTTETEFLEDYPWYDAIQKVPMPYLFKWDPVTRKIKECGLTSHVSSGSYGYGPLGGPDYYNYGWEVNAIGTFDNRVYLDYSSGSMYSRLGQRRHFLAAYDGISFSGSTTNNTMGLTAPSGSVKDLMEWKGDFYAIVDRGQRNRYHIAKATRGLENLATTEGHWKFNENLSDISGNSHDLAGTNINPRDYIPGISEGGKTAVKLSDHFMPEGMFLSAATATDFDMAMSSFSVELIIKVEPEAPSRTVFINKWNNDTEEGFRIGVMGLTPVRVNYGKLYIQLGDGSNTITMPGRLTVNDGLWHYIVITVDRSSNLVRSYIDGKFDAIYSLTSITGNISANTKKLEIGRSSTDLQLVGAFDEICISKELLSYAVINTRHERIRNRDMSWAVHEKFTFPLLKFFDKAERFMVSTGEDNRLRYLNEDTDSWSLHTPVPPFHNSPETGYVSLLQNPSGGFYGVHNTRVDYTDKFFDTAIYRYVYPPAISIENITRPVTIPGYRKQLDFLMDAASVGGTRNSMKKVSQAFTLISPEISEVATRPGWKLSTRSGSISRVSENIWRFDSSIQLRIGKWASSHLTTHSGSAPQNRLVTNYLILNNSADNTLTVAPIHNQNLDWNLRRIE